MKRKMKDIQKWEREDQASHFMKKEIQDDDNCVNEGEKEKEEVGHQGEKRQLDAEDDREEDDDQIVLR